MIKVLDAIYLNILLELVLEKLSIMIFIWLPLDANIVLY